MPVAPVASPFVLLKGLFPFAEMQAAALGVYHQKLEFENHPKLSNDRRSMPTTLWGFVCFLALHLLCRTDLIASGSAIPVCVSLTAIIDYLPEAGLLPPV